MGTKDILQLIEYLISGGYLYSMNGEYPTLKVTELGIEVLKGKQKYLKKKLKKSNNFLMKKLTPYLKR